MDRLEAWKIDLLNRPILDELSKVKRLNMTGQTEELFERWRNQWDDVVTVKLPNLEEMLFDAEEYIDRYRFQKAKSGPKGHLYEITGNRKSNKKYFRRITRTGWQRRKKHGRNRAAKRAISGIKKNVACSPSQFR